jgi:hypothetical protein
LVDTINYEEAWIEQHQSGDNQSHCIGVIWRPHIDVGSKDEQQIGNNDRESLKWNRLCRAIWLSSNLQHQGVKELCEKWEEVFKVGKEGRVVQCPLGSILCKQIEKKAKSAWKILPRSAHNAPRSTTWKVAASEWWQASFGGHQSLWKYLKKENVSQKKKCENKKTEQKRKARSMVLCAKQQKLDGGGE